MIWHGTPFAGYPVGSEIGSSMPVSIPTPPPPPLLPTGRVGCAMRAPAVDPSSLPLKTDAATMHPAAARNKCRRWNSFVGSAARTAASAACVVDLADAADASRREGMAVWAMGDCMSCVLNLAADCGGHFRTGTGSVLVAPC